MIIKFGGGEGGIRTHGTVFPFTRFPSVLFKPLRHLSVKKFDSHVQGNRFDLQKTPIKLSGLKWWWEETESNCRHEDFQSSALPTELSSPTKILQERQLSHSSNDLSIIHIFQIVLFFRSFYAILYRPSSLLKL